MTTSKHCGLKLFNEIHDLAEDKKRQQFSKVSFKHLFYKTFYSLSAMLRIHKVDIPRIICAMSVIPALSIHSSCVYTSKIALAL